MGGTSLLSSQNLFKSMTMRLSTLPPSSQPMPNKHTVFKQIHEEALDSVAPRSSAGACGAEQHMTYATHQQMPHMPHMPHMNQRTALVLQVVDTCCSDGGRVRTAGTWPREQQPRQQQPRQEALQAVTTPTQPPTPTQPLTQARSLSSPTQPPTQPLPAHSLEQVAERFEEVGEDEDRQEGEEVCEVSHLAHPELPLPTHLHHPIASASASGSGSVSLGSSLSGGAVGAGFSRLRGLSPLRARRCSSSSSHTLQFLRVSWEEEAADAVASDGAKTTRAQDDECNGGDTQKPPRLGTQPQNLAAPAPNDRARKSRSDFPNVGDLGDLLSASSSSSSSSSSRLLVSGSAAAENLGDLLGLGVLSGGRRRTSGRSLRLCSHAEGCDKYASFGDPHNPHAHRFCKQVFIFRSIWY